MRVGIMNHQNPPIQILKDKDLYVFDMDGTIYLGKIVFDFAIRFIENLRIILWIYSNRTQFPVQHARVP